MIIAVYGAGYVGLVSAACFAKIGHHVICADINKARVSALVKGECPIYEDQLPELLREQSLSGSLLFTDDLSQAMKQATIHFVATGTPSKPDGQADLSQVYAVVTQLAHETISSGSLVIKSTVPVGTGDAIQSHLNKELSRLGKPYQINVLSNPEFLREGNAVEDFFEADRIVIGGETEALAPLKELYKPFLERNIPLLCMSRQSAELTKYAANAMLACRVSFMNQISRIAEKTGANIGEVQHGIGTDKRIGPHFLRAGIGYGGSCFPKDTRALVYTARSLGVETPLLDAIEQMNQLQKNWVVERLNEHFKHKLQDKVFGIWGVSFKPDTDDVREASSLVIIEALLTLGVRLRLYDPAAMPAARSDLPHTEALTWCSSAEEVLMGSIDALVIATEWQEFKNYSLSGLRQALPNAPIVDGRNCFDLLQVKDEKIAYYYSVGRPSVIQGQIHDKGI